MLRAKIFRYISKNILYDNVVLQNSVKINHLHSCQCMSSTNFIRKYKEPGITSKEPRSESIKVPQTNNLSEQQFLVRLKNDPDKFGSAQEQEILDEGDIKEEKYFTEQPCPSQKLSTKKYADIIKSLIRQRKIKEAIDVLEVRMLKEDRVKPESYIFNLLLGACGRVGYTKKAFMLYNDMKKRGLNVMGGTYTALFNACANSPWPTTDGLTRATHLRDIMIEKGYQPNDTNYNAMIKAFGRCGDLPMAFTLADEMSSKGFKIKDDTINFLLQACISDKEAGFRHALLTWRILVNKKIIPSLYTYNLMLRCIRDCGLGNLEVTKDVINRILPGANNLEQSKRKLLGSSEQKLLSSSTESGNKEGESKEVNIESVAEESSEINTSSESSLNVHVTSHAANEKPINLRPNLMATIPHLGSIISLSEITKPEERLLLVGGCGGFLENMREYGCTPDIKTFTQLLDTIPNTAAAEKELLVTLRSAGIKPDIDFYNMLIKKRSMRFDYEGGKEVLMSMAQQKFYPNIITFGVLALGCKTKEEAKEMLNELKARRYRLNAAILGAMLHQACYHMNFSYALEVMETCLREDVHPNKKFMETLVQFNKKCKYSKDLTKDQEIDYIKFRTRYKAWRNEVQVDETENAHPWQQYRQTTEGGKNYKWKDGARFKARHTSLFKVKTSLKHRNN